MSRGSGYRFAAESTGVAISPFTSPARYSFTDVKDGDRWMIVDHHSSAVPPPR